jgi:hypothetical protein
VKVVVVVVERMEEMAKAGIDKVWLAAGAVGTWVPSGGGCRVEWSGFGHAWVDVWMCGCVDAWMRGCVRGCGCDAGMLDGGAADKAASEETILGRYR